MEQRNLFKKLSFFIGVILIVSFVEETEVPLPLRSEIKLSQSGGDFKQVINEIIIKQESSKIIIVNFSDVLHKPGPGIREGTIPVGDFKLFWDSLNSLNFWQLKEGYSGSSDYMGAWVGEISVSYEKEENTKKIKIIRFGDPYGCPLEFKRIYDLFISMERYAQFQPDLRDLLKYGEMTSDRWGRFWYQELANAEIGRIKDPKYLDTLVFLLPRETTYEQGIILALQNIGDKKAIPVIKNFLAQLELREPSWSHGGIILTALQVLTILEGRKSIRILKKYLNNKYELWVRGKVSIMLIKLNDYSAIPSLITFLKENYFNANVDLALRQISKDKRVISVLIKALKEEMNEKELNDIRVGGTIQGLSVVTGQENYSYNPSDLLEIKKMNINKWIEWWEENKDKFK